jgi:hypothetical protein
MMKNFKNWFLFLLAAFMVMAAPTFGQDAEPVETQNIFTFWAANSAVILGALWGISEVLSLIPSIKANGVFQFLFNLLKAAKDKIKK